MLPAGCTFCAPPMNKLSPEVIHACSSEFFKAYAYSKCTLHTGYDFASLLTCAAHDNMSHCYRLVRLFLPPVAAAPGVESAAFSSLLVVCSNLLDVRWVACPQVQICYCKGRAK